MRDLHKLVPMVASGGSGTRTRSWHITAPQVKTRRVMKKMMQIEEDGEDDGEVGKDKLHTSPTMSAIQELMFTHSQTLVLI